jgi:hypothetical protein
VKLGNGQESKFFHGDWGAWRDRAKSDRMVLEQVMDYVGRVPVRAGIYDPVTKSWELLWRTDSPNMPPSPPGVMTKALDQKPRWKLPRDLTHAPIGSIVRCSPVVSEMNNAYVFSETRDYAQGTFSKEFWAFAIGSEEPQRFSVELPEFKPADSFTDQNQVIRVFPCEAGFVLTDEDQGRVWKLKWDFAKNEPAGK